MTTFKKRIAVLAMALLLALTAYAPLAQTFARADGEEAIQEEPIDVYYFTDSAENSAYYSQAVSELQDFDLTFKFNWHANNVTENNIFYSTFETAVAYLYRLNAFDDIADSPVIFEMRATFSDRNFPHILCEIFKKLKNNGCRIMFIDNTDETRLGNYTADDLYDNPYTDFLDYADIHISTDYTTPFLFSSFYCINSDDNLNHSMFMLDSIMSTYTNSFFLPCLLLLNRISPYMFNLPFYSDGFYTSIIAYLKNFYDIDLVCQEENDSDSYRNLSTGTTYRSEDFVNLDLWEKDYIYAFGTTFIANAAKQFISTICDIQDTFARNSLAHILIGGDGYPDDADLPQYCYLFGMAKDTELAHIWSAIEDFIRGNDLTKYDNWNGRCNVTYSPLAALGGIMIPYYQNLCDFFGIEYSAELCFNFWSIFYGDTIDET